MEEPRARQTSNQTARSSILGLGFGLGCALLGVFKLWLVAPDEIVARAYPLDQQRYAEMIQSLTAGDWFGPYDHKTLIRGPAYPLWAAAVQRSGVPLRLANEGLLLAAALLFSAVLLRLGCSRLLALSVFALLVLQPHALAVNRELLAASFYTPLLWVAAAGLLLALAAPGSGAAALHAGWAGLALGLLWNTRPETPLVALLPPVVAGFALLSRRAGGEAWGAAAQRAALLLLLPLAGVAVLTAGFGELNRRHYGVSQSSDLSAPGFTAANRALLSIEHAAPRRYVPVPAEVRVRAYAVSPSFASLADRLESDGWARAATCNLVDVCDDIGGGWFIWWLREAAQRSGQMPTAARGDAFFQRIADEIEGACARGELDCHETWLDYLHPHPQSWLPQLANSMRRVARRMAIAGDWRDWDETRDPPETPAAIRSLFDEVANRREGLTSNGQARIEGSASASGDRITTLGIGRTYGESDPGDPGGAAAVPGKPRPGGQRFELEIEKPTRELVAMKPVLRVGLASGARVDVPLPAEGAVQERDGVRVAVTKIEETGEVDALRRGLRTALWNAHALFIRGVTLCGLLAGVWLLRPPWRGRFSQPVFGAVLLIGAIVISRFVVLALVDASSFSARSSRYVYPIVGLYGVGWLLVTAEATREWRRLRAARRR